MKLAALAIVLAAGSASAAEKKPNAIELAAFGGYGWMLPIHVDRSHQLSAWNGGGALAGTILYRSRYFVSPFVDAGYFPLYRSRDAVDLGSAGGAAVSVSSLAAWGFAAGVAADVWRLRLRAGLAFYDLFVHSRVLGSDIHPSELDGGYMFAIGGYIVRSERLQVGAEVRAGFIVEADTTFIALGSTVSGKAITW